jgi:hypothetical protein
MLAIYYRFYCSDMKALAKQKKPGVESEETKSDAAGVAAAGLTALLS